MTRKIFQFEMGGGEFTITTNAGGKPLGIDDTGKLYIEVPDGETTCDYLFRVTNGQDTITDDAFEYVCTFGEERNLYYKVA